MTEMLRRWRQDRLHSSFPGVLGFFHFVVVAVCFLLLVFDLVVLILLIFILLAQVKRAKRSKPDRGTGEII